VLEGLEGLDGPRLLAVACRALERVTAEVSGDTDLGCDSALIGQGLLQAADRAVDGLGAQVLDGAVGDDALTSSVQALHRLERRVAGEKLRRIAELDQRKAHTGKAPCTADWLAQKLQLGRGEAKGQTDAAAALARLPKTARKLRDGDLGLGQARQAARSLSELDRLADAGLAVPPDAASTLDDHVASEGPEATAGQLRQSIDAHVAAATPDVLARREARAHTRRRLWLGSPGADGTTPIEGCLDVRGAATLLAALDALSRRAGPDDDRSFVQRRHDALVELAQRGLDGGDLPRVAAQRPHVIVTATQDGIDGVAGAEPPRLDGYGPISSATARMVACDGEVTEVTVDQHGRPLMVKDRPKPTRRQRRAVIARDRCCVGCGARVSRCELHHIVWRRNHGATVVENLVLVCWACHHGIHHNGWTVEQTTPGRYTIRRPHEPAAGGASGVGGAGAGAGDPDLLRHSA